MFNFDEVVKDLKGLMSPFLDMVKRDHTLDLELRPKGFDVFYRGEALVQARSESKGVYLLSFTSIINFKDKQKETISSSEDATRWCDMHCYQLKKYWDIKLRENNKTEREFQQLVVRENNYSPVSIDTDYFITNMEDSKSVSGSANYMRVDAIGIRWNSNSQARKGIKSSLYYPKLVLIEVKFGDDSIGDTKNIGTKADLLKHLNDAEAFLDPNNQSLEDLKQETIEMFKCKRELGLLYGVKEENQKIEKLSEDKPEYIVALIDHDPDSSKLKDVLKVIDWNKYKNFTPYFAEASNLGYGLYTKRMFTPQEMQEKLEKDFS